MKKKDSEDNEAHVQNITSFVSTLRQLDRNHIIIKIENYMYSVCTLFVLKKMLLLIILS